MCVWERETRRHRRRSGLSWHRIFWVALQTVNCAAIAGQGSGAIPAPESFRRNFSLCVSHQPSYSVVQKRYTAKKNGRTLSSGQRAVFRFGDKQTINNHHLFVFFLFHHNATAELTEQHIFEKKKKKKNQGKLLCILYHLDIPQSIWWEDSVTW